MTPDTPRISDYAIWFRHLPDPALRAHLSALVPEGEILLETNRVKGRWRRMKRGRDGRLPDAVIPVGPMKDIWGEWFRTRRGEPVEVRLASMADDYLTATAPLFSEWTSAEDDEAFRDL